MGFGLCLWDADTGRPLRRFIVSSNPGSLAFSPDGKRLCVGGIPTVFDVGAGKELFQLGDFGWPVAYSTDGKTLASGENIGPGRVVLWDATSGKRLRICDGHQKGVRALAFSPDSKTIASVGEDKAVRLWDVATGNEVRSFDLPKGSAYAVAFAPPEGKVLAAAGEDGVVRLWDWAAGKLLRTLQHPNETLTTLAFTSDGKLLATGGHQGVICLWDPNTGKEVRHWNAHTSIVSSIALAPGNKQLASAGSWDHAIRRWDVATGKEIEALSGHTGAVIALQLSPDGKTLFSCGRDRRCAAWDLANARLERQANLPAAEPGRLDFWQSVHLSNDGKLAAQAASIAPARDDGQWTRMIRLSDAATGKQLHSAVLNAVTHAVRISPDGKVLASSGADGIRLWDTANLKELVHLKSAQTASLALAFSPDGKVFVSGGADKIIRLLEVPSGKEIRGWPSPHDTYWGLVVSPDGRFVAATGSENGSPLGSVRVWNMETGEQLYSLPADDTGLALGFSPSSRILAVATTRMTRRETRQEEISTIYLWDMYSGQEIRNFESTQGSVWSLAFTRDGRSLISGGGDSTILVWDIAAAKASRENAALNEADLKRLWADLLADGRKAEVALWKLAAAPAQSVPYLREQLRPPVAVEAEKMAALLADLESAVFATRQKTTQTLEELGESAEAGIRKALQEKPSLDARQRLERLLQRLQSGLHRKLRAIEALEHSGTAEARKVLETVAREAGNPQLTTMARAALERRGR
jgi:WD40 repeat protein